MAIKIAQDRYRTEYEIKREAHGLLEEALGERYVVRGEYHYGGCRFDLAIFDAASRDLVCTIEVKRRKGNRHGTAKKHVDQTNKYYRRTNKPCVLLTDKTMHAAIAAVKKKLSSL